MIIPFKFQLYNLIRLFIELINNLFIIVVTSKYLVDNMDYSIIQDLDYEQSFQQIEIQSENQKIKLNNVNFETSMNKLQEKINEMAQSNFYKNITVYFGAKSKQNINYLEEYYEKKLEMLEMELEEEKQHLKNIIEAVDQDDLHIKEKQHKRNELVIKTKRQEIKYPHFIPCFYINSEKKKPIYGQITQEFSRRGMGNFIAKLGYRSPFLKYDTLELNLEWPITSLRKKYYQAGLEWTNPIKNYGSFSWNLSSAKEPTYKNIDSQLSSVGCGLYKDSDKYEIQLGYRKPFLHEDIQNGMKNQFYRPSRKFALKYKHVFSNTIKFQDVAQGKYSEVKTQLGLPLLGDAKYFKVQYNYRRFFDTFKIRKLLDNQLAKKFFWKSTMQTNLSLASIAEYGRHHYVNDVLDSIQVRGFDSYRKPVPSYINAKASLKFNIHNYPVLMDARIVTFLYSQVGTSILKTSPFKPYLLTSTGLGLSFYAGPSTQIEILCNALQWQNKPLRQPLNFQIRFGVFD